MAAIDHTHDPATASWIASANEDGTDFPVQNLPFCAYRRDGEGGVGIGIGDQILDLGACAKTGLLEGLPDDVIQGCVQDALNGLLAVTPEDRNVLRHRVFSILTEGGEYAERAQAVEGEITVTQTDAKLVLPFAIQEFTDFAASAHHGRRMTEIMGHTGPPPPNAGWLPIAYGGRVSTMVVSGTPIPMPMGQLGRGPDAPPDYGKCETMDYELEIGIVLGPGNEMGQPIPLDEAEAHIFGFALLNDWSARDIQRWESTPLGPFLGKNFNTSLAPWVVTLEAMAPFRSPINPPPPALPERLPYLVSEGDKASGGLDITLEANISTAKMRDAGDEPQQLSENSFLDMHWTAAQLVAYHSSNGCKLGPGDIIGSGTISGPKIEAAGCLMELAQAGREPIELPGGESRGFVEVGDEVVFRAHAARDGRRTIGFGECRGAIV